MVWDRRQNRRQLKRILRMFMMRSDSTGPRVIEDAAGLILMNSGCSPEELDSHSRSLLLAFARRAGILDGLPNEQSAVQVSAYLQSNPIPEDLYLELEAQFEQLARAS